MGHRALQERVAWMARVAPRVMGLQGHPARVVRAGLQVLRGHQEPRERERQAPQEQVVWATS
jgi:hypothetical protein